MHALRTLALLAALLAFGRPSSSATIVSNLRYFVGQGYTRVVVDMSAKAEYAVGRVNEPGRIRIWFDVAGATLTKELATRSLPLDAGLLKQIRVGQYNTATVRVVLDFTEETKISSFMIANPYRLVIDILGTGSSASPHTGSAAGGMPPPAAMPSAPTPTPPTPIPAPKTNSNGTYSMARQLGLGIQLIVIDAGHGGNDPGCMSRGKVAEKTMTLDLARKLKTLVEEKIGCQAVLTRDEDRYIPLEERTAIANTLKADLFVSIHLNSARNTSIYGTETYFLNFATDERAMEVAARENAMSSKNMGELQTLVQKIALNSKIEESREFASIMQRSLIGKMTKYNPRVKNLGVKQAPFYVLIGAQMPAILVEANFLSNSNEEKLLKSSIYRAHLSEAILAGIMEYVSTFNKPVAADVAGQVGRTAPGTSH